MNESKLSKWQAADYLLSQEEIDEFVQLALRSGDAEHIKHALQQAKKAQARLSLPITANWTKSVDKLVEMAREFGYQLTFTPIKKSAR